MNSSSTISRPVYYLLIIYLWLFNNNMWYKNNSRDGTGSLLRQMFRRRIHNKSIKNTLTTTIHVDKTGLQYVHVKSINGSKKFYYLIFNDFVRLWTSEIWFDVLLRWEKDFKWRFTGDKLKLFNYVMRRSHLITNVN